MSVYTRHDATLPSSTVIQSKLERLTPNTIVDRRRFLAELEVARAEGVAYDREEHTLGICGLGCVVRDPVGRVASVSVPMPAQRFYGNEKLLARKLRDACREIEAALGAG